MKIVNSLLIFGFLSCLNIYFGQSKKEQIELLNKQIDSLLFILKSERNSNIERLSKIKEIDSVTSFLENKIFFLDSNINILKLDYNSCKLDISKIQGELTSKQQLIDKIQYEFKIKSDSLSVLRAEYEKLKSESKQNVSNKMNVSIKETQIEGVNAVKIGTQIWMTQNLNTNKFRNGDLIPEARTEEEWKNAGKNKKPAWCYYENNASNGVLHGKLYNWYAVNDSRGLAPLGWHVPTDAEWAYLKNQLADDAGQKIKSKNGWTNWDEELVCKNCQNWSIDQHNKTVCSVCKNTKKNGKKTHSGNGSNQSFLSGLPGGYRYFNGFFVSIGLYGFWWSSTEISNDHAFSRFLTNSSSSFNSTSNAKEKGFSVRCLKD